MLPSLNSRASSQVYARLVRRWKYARSALYPPNLIDKQPEQDSYNLDMFSFGMKEIKEVQSQ